MEILKKFELNKSERIIQEVYHHLGIIIPHLIISAVILVLDFFLLAFLFMQGWWGVILFFTIILVVAFYLMRLMFLFKKNRFVITNQRILDFEQSGFFEHFINEVYYEKIKEVEIQIKGIGAHVMHYGDIKIFLNDEIVPLELYKIPEPKKIQDEIHKLIETDLDDELADKVNDPVDFIMAEVDLLNRGQKIKLVQKIKKRLRLED